MTHVADVLNAISNDKSLTIFKIISLAKGDNNFDGKYRFSRKKKYWKVCYHFIW